LIAEPWTVLYTKPAVVVGLLYVYLPLMILPIYASLRGLEPEMGEGATDLGARPIRVLWDIHIPLAMPGVITGSIFVFVPSMGNFVIPELLGGGKTILLGNLLRDQFLRARDWPFGSVLAMAMVAILMALFLVQAIVTRRVSQGVGR
ncbi:MAG: ABC transporter permease, partial [Angustibacter sp.]